MTGTDDRRLSILLQMLCKIYIYILYTTFFPLLSSSSSPSFVKHAIGCPFRPRWAMTRRALGNPVKPNAVRRPAAHDEWPIPVLGASRYHIPQVMTICLNIPFLYFLSIHLYLAFLLVSPSCFPCPTTSLSNTNKTKRIKENIGLHRVESIN